MQDHNESQRPNCCKVRYEGGDRGNKDNEIKLMAARGYVFTEFSGGFEIACNTIAELIH